MSSTALRIVAAITVLVAIVLAFAAYNISRQYAARSQQAAAPVQTEPSEPKTLAVVATKPLAAYKPIDRESVQVAPVAVLPEGHFTTLDQVVGKVPLLDIDAGAPVTGRYFQQGNALARVIPQGHRAISLEISEVIAVGGFLRPGDIVDVLMYVRGGGDTKAQSRILLKDIRVLAYEERIIDRPEGLEDEGEDKRRRQRTAVVAVAETDTTRLMLGISLGDVRLALHGQSLGVPEVTMADLEAVEATGKLPITEQAKAADAASQVPDMAITADQLTAVKPPPAQRRPRHKVYVYRGTDVQTVYE